MEIVLFRFLQFINPPSLNITLVDALEKGVHIMLKHVKSFYRDEDGATAIEYGLIAALVSVAAIAALGTLGNALTNIFSFVATSLESVVPVAPAPAP